MPTEGDNFDELLSGFLDGELDSDEFKSVQSDLGSDADTRRQLDELSELSTDVKSAFRIGTAKPQLDSSELVARVLAEAQREAVQAGLPEDHHVRLVEQEAIVDIATGRTPGDNWSSKYGGSKVVWAAIATLAAAILLAAGLPRLFDTPDVTPPIAVDDSSQPSGTDNTSDSSDNPQLAINGDPVGGNASKGTTSDGTESSPLQEAIDASAVEESTPQPVYVSQMNFSTQLVLVVDIELSGDGFAKDAFGEVLRKHGLLREQPILGGAEIVKAVSETRMTVRPEEDAKASDASIYFMRADMNLLGAALDDMYFNKKDFANIALSISIDNPMARLMEKIASGSGNRFAVKESFAVPVVLESSESPLTGLRKPTRFISKEGRDLGFSGDATASMLDGSSENLSSLLFFVR